MAGKGVDINIGMNTRDVQAGAKDVEAAFSKVSDALDDVSKDSAKAGDGIKDGLTDGAKAADKSADKIERSFKDVIQDSRRAGDKMGDNIADGSREAAKSTEKIERSFDKVADAAKRESSAAGNAMHRNIKNGTDGASEAVAEFGDEAKANISETFSSFRGDAEDLVGIAQDTFGGVIANLGPLGMAAGAAGALGIGLLMGEFERAKEAEAELRAQVGELAGQLIDLGGDPAGSVEAVAEGLKELATNSEEGEVTLAGLRDIAEGSASGFKRLSEAYAGNSKGLEELLKLEEERYEQAEKATAADKGWNAARNKRLTNARQNQEQVVEGLREVVEATKAAEAEEAAWLASSGPAMEARANQMNSLQGEIDEAIGSWTDYMGNEEQATDPAAYIDAMQARVEATSNFNANVEKLAEEFNLSAEAVQAILDQGVDFAPMLQSIMSSGMGKEYAAQVESMLTGGQAIVDGTPINATVKAEADTGKASADLDATAGKNRTATVDAKASTRPAESAIKKVADKSYTATVKAKADTAAASRALTSLVKERKTTIKAEADLSSARNALDNFVNQRRTVTITAEVVDRKGNSIP